MTTFITLAHQKGGVGKSTLALSLYDYFRQAGIKAAVVDADAQGTITDLHELGILEEFPLILRKDFKTFDDLRDMTKGYDLVLIDTPPYHTRELREIFKITRFLILPCKPSLPDVLAIRQTIKLVKAEMVDKGFLVSILMTMVIPGSTVHLEAIKALEQAHGLPIFKTLIHNRVSYTKSLFLGATVVDDADNSKARAEIEALAAEILDRINQNT